MQNRRNVITYIMLATCAPWRAMAQSNPPVKVVATFSILADLAKQVGGDRIEVTSLVGPNGDAHVYQPSPADAKKVAEAALVIRNGLGLEGWFERFIAATGAKPRIVVAGQHVKPFAEGQGRFDPHAWQDIANVRAYVADIRDGLTAADPAGRTVYDHNASAYLDKLTALETEVRVAIASIPPERRRIITTHDAFGYFGRAYGMAFIAPQGVSTDSEPTARDVAAIIRQIRTEKVPAVFLENISDDRLMQRIAKESGAKVGGKLYSDALSEPTGPAGTYIDMMRNNIREFTAALRP